MIEWVYGWHYTKFLEAELLKNSFKRIKGRNEAKSNKFGGKTVNLKDYSEAFEVDSFKKTIKIHQPIIVTKVESGGLGLWKYQ